EKATRAYGLRQALELYEAALAAGQRLGDRVPASTLIAIHRDRADLFFGIGDFPRSREEAEHLLGLARRVEDRPAEASAPVQNATARQSAAGFGTRPPPV